MTNNIHHLVPHIFYRQIILCLSVNHRVILFVEFCQGWNSILINIGLILLVFCFVGVGVFA